MQVTGTTTLFGFARTAGAPRGMLQCAPLGQRLAVDPRRHQHQHVLGRYHKATKPVIQRAIQAANQEAAYARQQAMLAKEQAFIARFKARRVESQRKLERAETNLVRVREQLANTERRLRIVRGDMNELPFRPEAFDLIWSEGAIYFMGFEHGLREWSKFLKKGGYVAVTEASWFTDERPDEINDFWKQEYPGIDTIPNKVKQMQSTGYLPVASFVFRNDVPFSLDRKRLQRKHIECQSSLLWLCGRSPYGLPE